jgi:hypothetical protein
MPIKLVVQNSREDDLVRSKYSSSKFSHFIRYRLAEPLQFDEPHYARLLYCGGSKDPLLVFTDFTERQHVNGEFHSFLGSSSPNSKSSWVALSSNYVPSVGIIKLSQTNQSSVPEGPKHYTLVIEIASESWIHGTQGEA